MMKRVLFLGLWAAMSVGAGAQNLVKNSDFGAEVATTIGHVGKATPGEWFILNNEKEGATAIVWNDATGDKKYPNAVKFDNLGAAANLAWYKAFLGQRITDGLEKGIYTLTFYARSKESDSPIAVYIKQSVEEKSAHTGKYGTTFFVRKDYNADSQPNSSGAQYSSVLKGGNKWTKVSVDFNTAKLINSFSSKKSAPELTITETPAEAAILKDCCVAIQALGKGSVIEVSDVTLQRKE